MRRATARSIEIVPRGGPPFWLIRDIFPGWGAFNNYVDRILPSFLLTQQCSEISNFCIFCPQNHEESTLNKNFQYCQPVQNQPNSQIWFHKTALY